MDTARIIRSDHIFEISVDETFKQAIDAINRLKGDQNDISTVALALGMGMGYYHRLKQNGEFDE